MCVIVCGSSVVLLVLVVLVVVWYCLLSVLECGLVLFGGGLEFVGSTVSH